MDRTAMMSMRRFRALLASYGAEQHLWPADERAPALALLDRSAEARALADAEREIDLALQAAIQRRAPVLPPGDGEGAALARLRSGIAAHTTPLGAVRRPQGSTPGLLALAVGVMHGRQLAFGAMAGISMLAGVSLGALEATPPSGGAGIAMLLQATPIAGLP